MKRWAYDYLMAYSIEFHPIAELNADRKRKINDYDGEAESDPGAGEDQTSPTAPSSP